MKVNELIKALIKLRIQGIKEICFCVCDGQHPANDFCYFDIDYNSKIAVLHNSNIYKVF